MSLDTVTVGIKGREYVYLSIVTDPPLAGTWEASGDLWATTGTVEAGSWTVGGVTYGHRVLVASSGCSASPVAGQVTIDGGRDIRVRNTTSPEVTDRVAARVTLR